MLENVPANESIQWNPTQRRGEIRDHGPEVGVAQGQVLVFSRPSQVQVKRKLAEYLSRQLGEGRCGAPVEIARGRVPSQLAAGKDQYDLVRGIGPKERVDLPRHPL